MTDEVAPVEGAIESPDDAAGAAPEATPAIDEATWKKRLAGKDQALTATQKERDALRSERDSYQRKIAEYENANLSEVERLQKQLAEVEAREQSAQQEATRLRLQGKYPLSFAVIGEKAPLDEADLAQIEARLIEMRSEEEAPINPNNPQRRPPSTPKPKTSADLAAELKSLGNPFRDLGWGA